MNIRNVKDIGGLVAYLAENLNWPAAVENVEEIADYMYDFTADDLGIRPDEFAKVESLRQLPPLVEEQTWGIFAVEFSSTKFSVMALRRILSRLVPNKRNAAEHAVWDCKDLLFFCFWGRGRNRRIMVAHFEETEDNHFLVRAFDVEPEVAGPIELEKFKERLSYLQWPNVSDNDRDPQMWRDTWLQAFDTYYRQVITTSAKLAVELARVAKDVKERILATLEAETERGFVHKLCDKVRKTLVHNLSTSEFADIYAQTIVYGLFSARCMDETPETFSAEEAISLIPTTNPFLKSLMRDCFQRRGKLSFDELGIGDIVELLSHVDAKVIADDFGRQSGGGREDPVIHFYEEFLKEYDKAQKVERGVFYTPQPVVTFTVRAVDYLLKTVFGLADGLACDAVRKVKRDVKVFMPRKKTFKVESREVEEPCVQILDPATGTGTYIRQTILQIYENFKAKWEGRAPARPQDRDALNEVWSRYVDAHVLPRLYAFELMMAPYAVAHMKLAMVLKDTGYDFKGGERLKVYLTNTLEEPGGTEKQMSLDFGESDPLATESLAANEAKKNGGINIVIGNPPYSGESQNKGAWIMDLMKEYKMEPGGKVKLKERNPKWINDDYVKFIRYGQERIRQAGSGILAYINPHGFIDNPTFRGMRWNLLREFDEIYILNLHGNSKKKETCPDGSKDENVFDIMQGVSINLFVKWGKSPTGLTGFTGLVDKEKNPVNPVNPVEKLATVHYADLYGARNRKYDFLSSTQVGDIEWKSFVPTDSMSFFKPSISSGVEDRSAFGVKELFMHTGTGVLTANDAMNISFSPSEQAAKLKDILEMPEAQWRIKYSKPHDVRDWIYSEAKNDAANKDMKIIPISYRPFDIRHTGYTGKTKGVYTNPRYELMRHIIGFQNVSLLTCRQTVDAWCHVSVASEIVDDCRVSNKTKERGYVFPLYLYDTAVEPPSRRVNFDAAIYKKICKAAGLKFSDQDLQATACKHESSACKSCPENSNPQLVFDYIYGVLHSGKYRKKYAEFLKIDFPRIPYPKNGEEFRTMAAFGAELRRIHCMEDFDEAAEVELVGGDGAPGGRALPVKPTVVKPVWKDGGVYIDKEVKFTNVAEDLWNFYIGGYQPLQKWLKDRKGRELSAEDVSHYKRMVRAIARTRDIMAKIEGCYELTACSCED